MLSQRIAPASSGGFRRAYARRSYLIPIRTASVTVPGDYMGGCQGRQTRREPACTVMERTITMRTRQFTQHGFDLNFRNPHAEFNYRIVAVFRLDGHVLVQRGHTDDFWALPGGHSHYFESAPDALRREMREEMGEDVEVGALAAVIEVVFGAVHEVNLCFDAALPAGSRLRDISTDHEGDEFGTRLIFRWIAIEDVQRERILPGPVAAMIAAPSAKCDYWFDDERRRAPVDDEDGHRG